MDASTRQKLLRVVELVNKHPGYAKAIGIRVVNEQREEGEDKRRW